MRRGGKLAVGNWQLAISKWQIVCVLVACLILFSGAAGCDMPKREDIGEKAISPFSNVKKGEEISGRGVVVSFLDGMPPSKLDEEEQFQVGFRFENYLTEPATIRLKVFDTLAEKVVYEEMDVYVEEAFIDDGEIFPGIEEVILPDASASYIYSGLLGKELRTHIIVELESDFYIESSPQFCVKQKDYSLSDCGDDEIWSSEEKIGHNVIYSPVAVTSVNKDVRHLGAEGETAKVVLELNFENVGGGDVLDDMVNNLKVETMHYGEFNCKAERQKSTEDFKLRNNKIVVKCTKEFDIYDSPVIQDPLDISYEYGYEIRKTIGPIDIIPNEDFI